MASDDRGPLLYAYRPIPANPMTVAVLLLVLVVTFGIGPIAAGPEGLWPLGGLCFVPLGLVLVAIAVFKPSPTFVSRTASRFRFRCGGGSRVGDATTGGPRSGTCIPAVTRSP